MCVWGGGVGVWGCVGVSVHSVHLYVCVCVRMHNYLAFASVWGKSFMMAMALKI